MDEKQSPTWQIILRSGLIGGVIATYLCLIGMVDAFSKRPLIGDYFSLGELLLVFGMVLAGVLAARELKAKKTFISLGGSMVSGLITSLPLILLIAITMVLVMRPALQGAEFTLRDMFINLSPGLVEILTFGQGLFPGIPILILVSVLMAILGAAFVLPSRRWRMGLISAITWTRVIGVFSDNVSLVVQQVFGDNPLGRRAIRRCVHLGQFADIISVFIRNPCAFFEYCRTLGFDFGEMILEGGHQIKQQLHPFLAAYPLELSRVPQELPAGFIFSAHEIINERLKRRPLKLGAVRIRELVLVVALSVDGAANFERPRPAAHQFQFGQVSPASHRLRWGEILTAERHKDTATDRRFALAFVASYGRNTTFSWLNRGKFNSQKVLERHREDGIAVFFT